MGAVGLALYYYPFLPALKMDNFSGDAKPILYPQGDSQVVKDTEQK